MRTTIDLDQDLLERVRAVSAEMGELFETVINQALRIGLNQLEEPAGRQHYKTRHYAMGLKAGLNLDDIQELLAQFEGEEPY